MRKDSGKNLVGLRFSRLTVLSAAPPVMYAHGTAHKWNCRCDCGKETIVYSRALTGNKTQSCGCLRKDWCQVRGKTLPPGKAAENHLVRNYRWGAQKRNLEFTLTEHEMFQLFRGNCAYCGRKPSARFYKRHSLGHAVYNGIDRLNSVNGYTSDNVVSCCKTCNYAKGKMTCEEFLIWIEQVYNHRLKNE